ncbi:MAG: Ig-like domain-containing protein [Candidatus Edwardsbacteria bacterium]|nr:Ig-like domain-containing protein [Candidatus Edwardsbacteria bacterium]
MKTSKVILLLAGGILFSGLVQAQYYQKSTLTTGIGPKNFAYNSDSGKVYVSNTGEATIGSIKNYSYQPCTLGYGPGQMAYNALTRKLFVATGVGFVYILDADNDTVETYLTPGMGPVNLAYNSAVNKLYANSSAYGLYIYNGSTYSQLNYFTGFEGRLYSYPGTQTYVAHGFDSLIGVIDGAGDGINDTIILGGVTSYSEMVGSPEMQKLYVTLPGRNQVGIINAATNSLITTVSVGAGPSALAYCPEHKKTYVACPGDINIWVIDSLDVASSFSLGDSITAVYYNQASRQVCFTDRNNSMLRIWDPVGDYLVKTINLPVINPAGIFADPVNGDIYLSLTGVGGPGTVAVMGYDTLAPTGAVIYNTPDIINTDTLTVFWSPGADPGGSGIVAYDVYLQPDSTEPSSYVYYPPDTSALLMLGGDSTMYHLMVVARDSAGNPLNVDYLWQDSVYVDLSYVLPVDSIPPAAPLTPLIYGTNPGFWLSSAYTTAQLIWDNPEPGIIKAFFKLGSPPGFEFDYHDSMHSSGGMADTFYLPVDTLNGDYQLYIWLADSSGNSDYNNRAAVGVRRDLDPPLNTMVKPFPGDTTYSTSFPVSWTGGMDALSGIASYRLNYRVDTSGSWYTVIDYHPDTLVVFPGAAPGHRYYFEAAAYDSAYNLETIFNVSEASVFVALSAADTTRPQIISTTPAQGDSLVSLGSQIYINFSEPVDTLSLRFHCAPDPGGWSLYWGFSRDYVMLGHNNLLPGTAYTITVDSLADSSGNPLAAGPAPNPWSFATKPSVTLSTAWQGGVYSLFSVPLLATDSSAVGMLGDDLGPYGSTGWRLMGYKTEVDSFVERPFITNGRGFWLASMNDAIIDAAGAVHDSFASVKIPMFPGWNLIGTPFNSPVSVASIQVVDTVWRPYSDPSSWDLVSPRIWHYTDNTPDLVNNGAWDSLSPADPAARMNPWKGYALYAAAGCSLYIQTLATKTGLPKTAHNEYRIDWQLEVSAASGRASDGGLRLGVSSQAREGYDRLDSEKPPLVSNQVKIYIPHDDWDRGPCRQYQYDFRPPADHIEWPLTAQTSDKEGALSFKLSGALPSGHKLYLADRSAGTGLEIVPDQPVGFSGTAQYSVIFTDRKLSQLNIKPLSLLMSRAAPNPFRNQMNLTYQIPRAGPVSITIYNITGQLVRTLVDQDLSPGYYSAGWDGRDDAGGSISSGVYFVRLASDGKSLTQKILKIK